MQVVTSCHFRVVVLGFLSAFAAASQALAELVSTFRADVSRGERSKFFGPSLRATKSVDGEYGVASAYLDVRNDVSDFFFKSYVDLEQLRTGYAAASGNARAMLAGYVAG